MQRAKLTLAKIEMNEYKINPRIAQLIITEFVFQHTTPKMKKYNPTPISIPASPCLGRPN